MTEAWTFRVKYSHVTQARWMRIALGVLMENDSLFFVMMTWGLTERETSRCEIRAKERKR